MQYKRILALGDIHGKYQKLSSVFNKINFDAENDFLILLGDYVDRGEENLHCLQWAMKISELPNVVALRGNHEQMMLNFYTDGSFASTIWLPNGGNKTRAEIEEWSKHDKDFLDKALKFISERPLYYRMFIGKQEYIFCHAGLLPGVPLEQQTEDSLLWIRDEFYYHYSGDAEVVVGHTPTPYLGKMLGSSTNQDSYLPVRMSNKVTLLDTGSFLPKGRITCMDILTGNFWQSDNFSVEDTWGKFF